MCEKCCPGGKLVLEFMCTAMEMQVKTQRWSAFSVFKSDTQDLIIDSALSILEFLQKALFDE
jgi:hypothetical protein